MGCHWYHLLVIFCYFFIKIYVEIIAPLNYVSNQNIRSAVKQVLFDDFEVSVLGGYVNYEHIKQLGADLSLEERKEFFRMIRLHADELETSSEFQTMLDLIENDSGIKPP